MKLFATILVLIIASVALNAQLLREETISDQQLLNRLRAEEQSIINLGDTPNIGDITDPLFEEKGGNSKQGITYRLIKDVLPGGNPANNLVLNSMGLEWGYNQSPVALDPKTGIASFAATRWTSRTSDQRFDSYLYLFTSNNSGSSWNARQAAYSTDRVFYRPSMGVVNLKNSTNPTEHIYNINTRIFNYNASTSSYPFTRGLWRHMLQGTDPNGNFAIDEYTPVDNNPGNFQYFDTYPVHSLEFDNTAFFFNGGGLSPNEGTQYGAYGFAGFYVDNTGNFDYTASGIPTAWGFNTFRPAPAVTSSYNSTMHIAVDPSANIYALVNNFFADDIENRLVGFSKSDDFGGTWSTFERLPKSIIDGYATANLENSDTWFLTNIYEPNAIVAYSEGNFSFIVPLLGGTDAGGGSINIRDCDLLEINYNNGTWTVSKIAEMSGLQIYILSNSADQGQPILDQRFDNPRGNEIQVALSADRSQVVVKWIDLVETIRTTSPDSMRVIGVDTDNDASTPLVTGTLDSINTTDVFMAYKTVGTGNWSEAVNITDDAYYNIGTYIPSRIMSASQVPLFSRIAPTVTNTAHERFGFPRFHQEMLYDLASYMAMNIVDATNPQSVEDNGAENTNLVLMPAYPNPAMDIVEIPFNMKNSGHVTIELFDALGNKVKTIANEYKLMGIHAINVNVSGLASGNYFYSMTFNGERFTQPLQIVR